MHFVSLHGLLATLFRCCSSEEETDVKSDPLVVKFYPFAQALRTKLDAQVKLAARGIIIGMHLLQVPSSKAFQLFLYPGETACFEVAAVLELHGMPSLDI